MSNLEDAKNDWEAEFNDPSGTAGLVYAAESYIQALEGRLKELERYAADERYDGLS